MNLEVDDKPRREQFFDKDVYIKMQGRMIELVYTLTPYQRNFFIAHHVDLYWYIQKINELETLLLRLEQEENPALRNYLLHLHGEIQSNLAQDELFIKQQSIFHPG